MSLSELLRFENPGVIAVAIGLLLFVLMFHVLKGKIDKGASLIISLVMGFLGGYYLYKQGIYGLESNIVAVLLIVAVCFIVLKIFFAFGKGARRQFGSD